MDRLAFGSHFQKSEHGEEGGGDQKPGSDETAAMQAAWGQRLAPILEAALAETRD